MSVAFDGMDNLVVTFRCSGTVEAGSPVILSANDTVSDGVTTGEAGKACLVVRVDAATSTLGLFL